VTRQEQTSAWGDANQRYLSASVAVVRALLAAHGAAARGEPVNDVERARAALREAEAAMPEPAALETLARAFGLSTFERQVLVMCAGMELDGALPAQVAEIHRDPHRIHPTFGLALAALPDAHWSAVTPSGPLRRWRLMDVLHGDSLISSSLRIDERVLHFLAGVPHLDERLQGLIMPAKSSEQIPASLHVVAHRVADVLAGEPGMGRRPVIQLHGQDRSGLIAVAAQASFELGLSLLILRAADIPTAIGERETLARLLEREVVLGRAAFLLDVDDADGADVARGAASFVEATGMPILIATRQPVRSGNQSGVSLQVERPTVDEQRELWRGALGPVAPALNGWIEPIVAQFSLSLPAIEAVGVQVRARFRTRTEDGPAPAATQDLGQMLWEACREQARPRLEDLTQRITPVAGWDDIVLPESQLRTLREISAHVRHRITVYEAWGFARNSTRGLGISALFAGPSGTGKTMAAEVLAGELRLDLYRIDLSQVVSKYIGETEKNLRRVFDAAEEGGAILLFDEADALFGKRSEVKDSHDRYANIEVSYLLQRMESYRGLAILTTNMKSALDPAFLRRIRFVVQFPFPDADQRAEIWRRIFPDGAPVDGLDVHRLARLNVAGGNIRNIALGAAFLAADAGEPVRMSHLLRAARSEYAKLEKPLTDAAIGGWP
jgi:hypothetical protein